MKTHARFSRDTSLRVVAAALCCIAAYCVNAQTFQYRATVLDGQVDRVGSVNANGLVWQCAASACTISGPWSRPGVHACATLAQLVGRIASYGHPGAMLNAAELAQCNANMPADGARAVPVNPGPAVVAGPGVVVAPVAVPAVPSTPVAQPLLVVRANDSLRYSGHRHLSGRSSTVSQLIYVR